MRRTCFRISANLRHDYHQMPSFLVIHIIIIIIYYTIILLIDYMGVDQNKGIWGSYNRRSTTNQPRSQRCQSREGSVVCNIILRRESSKHCYISQYLKTWREPGPTQAGLAIAGQSRINREPIADFIDMFWKLIWSGLLDFELVVLCCSDSSLLLAITSITIEHSVKADPNIPNTV